ncbi:MAG: hypothetical protein H0V53_02870 [Rubrobacter sp.]|nr:hypothetical protein [Rubrobacter sp.]
MSRSRGLRLPEDLEKDIERESDLRGGASFSELAISLLREAVRMRRVPGIYFVDGLDSREAAVTGTGIEGLGGGPRLQECGRGLRAARGVGAPMGGTIGSIGGYYPSLLRIS